MKPDSAELPDLGINITNKIPSINIGEEGVLNLLKGLDSNKAPGPGEIPAHLFKESAGSITPILTPIYQAGYIHKQPIISCFSHCTIACR